ncbi:MAG: hypothetical protein EBZ75_12810 [Oxalobacteraceae bacterium]|nr:hypothetical protein [Oxalobacteraceae bacterium]
MLSPTTASSIERTTIPLSPPPSISLRETLSRLQQQNHTESQFEALLYRVEEAARAAGGTLRVGMYDGSFDPPHKGHVETANAAVGFARLNLLVVNSHPLPCPNKPNLSPHEPRTKMLVSYFAGDPITVVSPLPRHEIETILAPYQICGIIGSDAFNRFLREGIAPDFNTDEIFVAERRGVPLESAPVTLEGRRIFYAGAEHLAFNGESSTKIREDLVSGGNGLSSTMLNGETARIARAESLYAGMPPSPVPDLLVAAPEPEVIINPAHIPSRHPPARTAYPHKTDDRQVPMPWHVFHAEPCRAVAQPRPHFAARRGVECVLGAPEYLHPQHHRQAPPTP